MIGIAISTVPERDEILKKSLEYHLKFMPNDKIRFHIESDINHDGVAATKNKCLSKLDSCDHIFLFDDDTYPIAHRWWIPYIESGENHLMYQFKLPGKPTSDMSELYRDDKIVSYTHTRGAMLYITKKVLKTVGGLDTRYRNGFEHPDWTNRIHNAGLTTHRAMDVPGSDRLLYCLDQDGKVESSIKKDVAQRVKNYQLYKKQWRSKEYMEYKNE